MFESQSKVAEKPPQAKAKSDNINALKYKVQRAPDQKPQSLATVVTPIKKSDETNEDFLRNKRKDDVSSRRRHTFETRERETDAERVRRISLDSKSPK